MSLVWELEHINTNELVLMLAIADHCNDEGVCYPSADRLRKKCKWASKTTYTKTMKILKEVDLISSKSRASRKDGRKTNLLIINPSKVHTGVQMHQLKAARAKFSGKTLKSTHGCTDGFYKALNGAKVHTGVHKPLEATYKANQYWKLKGKEIEGI